MSVSRFARLHVLSSRLLADTAGSLCSSTAIFLPSRSPPPRQVFSFTANARWFRAKHVNRRAYVIGIARSKVRKKIRRSSVTRRTFSSSVLFSKASHCLRTRNGHVHFAWRHWRVNESPLIVSKLLPRETICPKEQLIRALVYNGYCCHGITRFLQEMNISLITAILKKKTVFQKINFNILNTFWK